MAKRKPARRTGGGRPAARRAGAKNTGSRRRAARPKSAARKSTRRAVGRTAKKPVKKAARQSARTRPARLDRKRRTLAETVATTPPSSLNMNRRPSAVRTGRRELSDNLKEHAGMTGVTGGDVDADFENAYFSGEEAPGGDNPTPDQDIVDDIGRSLGVEYQDNEELKPADKVIERDKHRWELDPASSEDYKDRK